MDAEAAVLSAVTVDPAALDKVLDFLKPEHFYAESHRRIFEACVELHAAGQPVDSVQVGSWLRSRERLAQIGGMAYLTEVLNAAPFVANVAAYARTIFDKWRVRQMVAAAQRVAAEGYIDCGEVGNYLDRAEQAIYDVAHAAGARDTMASGLEVVKEGMGELVAALNNGKRMMGVPTGFDRYDKMTAGLHDTDLTIVGGRPGMAKTAWALAVALNVAGSHLTPKGAPEPATPPEKNGVVIFQLEMPRKQVGFRLMCAHGRVDVGKIRQSDLTPLDWQKLTEAATHIGRLPLWIDDQPAISLLEVRAKVRRKQAEYDKIERDSSGKITKIHQRVRLVIIDYLQLMRAQDTSLPREQQVADISKGLKVLAKELGVAVIVLAQLNRAVEARANDKRPQLSDLRESGSIEQDADNIVFLYRDEYYSPDSNEAGIAELLLRKQRNGPTGTAKVRFDKEYTRFENLPPGEYEDAA